jgi:hypothetical protein
MESMPRRKHREVIEDLLELDDAGAAPWPRPQQSSRR